MPNFLKSFSPEGYQFAWDATSLGNYMKCPAYYYYVNLQGWQPRNKSVHLIFGGLYATALEHYYKLVADGTTPLDATHAVVREALIETWVQDEETGEASPWISGHDKKTRETLIRTIVWYLDQFELSPVAVATPVQMLENGKPAVELSFSVPFDDEFIWCGHIDRLVEYNNQTYVMDQKTTGGSLTSYYFRGFALDVQMSGYTFGASIGFNIPVKGVIIDAAQILIGGTKFARGFVNRSPSQLDEWRATASYYMREARKAVETNTFAMNTTSCMNYGGCAFHAICERSPAHRPNFLEADFVRRPRWDPLQKR